MLMMMMMMMIMMLMMMMLVSICRLLARIMDITAKIMKQQQQKTQKHTSFRRIS
jgi:hypothetical protein